jgi:hypothetical protein
MVKRVIFQRENRQFKRIELTYPEPEWKPSDVQYSEEEARFIHNDGTLREHKRTTFACETHNEERFISELMSMVIVDGEEEERNVSSATTRNTFTLSPEALSRTWGIGLIAAKRTLEATTQKGVRSVVYPSVERRWPTGDRTLRYRKLNCKVYHEALYSRIPSQRGSKCAEIYATDFGWARIFPMTKESEVHETLDLFLSRYAVPEALISDGAKAYTSGKFRQKAKEAGCFLQIDGSIQPVAESR